MRTLLPALLAPREIDFAADPLTSGFAPLVRQFRREEPTSPEERRRALIATLRSLTAAIHEIRLVASAFDGKEYPSIFADDSPRTVEAYIAGRAEGVIQSTLKLLRPRVEPGIGERSTKQTYDDAWADIRHSEALRNRLGPLVLPGVANEAIEKLRELSAIKRIVAVLDYATRPADEVAVLAAAHEAMNSNHTKPAPESVIDALTDELLVAGVSLGGVLVAGRELALEVERKFGPPQLGVVVIAARAATERFAALKVAMAVIQKQAAKVEETRKRAVEEAERAKRAEEQARAKAAARAKREAKERAEREAAAEAERAAKEIERQKNEGQFEEATQKIEALLREHKARAPAEVSRRQEIEECDKCWSILNAAPRVGRWPLIPKQINDAFARVPGCAEFEVQRRLNLPPEKREAAYERADQRERDLVTVANEAKNELDYDRLLGLFTLHNEINPERAASLLAAAGITKSHTPKPRPA